MSLVSTCRSSVPPVKTDVAPPEREQPFGVEDLFSLICPELGVAPLSDPGTELEDELPSPDSSPVVIGHRVALLPAQVKEDVDLADVGSFWYPTGDRDPNPGSSRGASGASGGVSGA